MKAVLAGDLSQAHTWRMRTGKVQHRYIGGIHSYAGARFEEIVLVGTWYHRLSTFAELLYHLKPGGRVYTEEI
jgi:hypothetical protein